MKRVAPELESLMWTLAEEGNERAIDEFGERHPDLKTELLQRIEMVKGLRGAKKKPVEPRKAIPRFVPRESTNKTHVYVVCGLVLAALCALSFAVTVLLTPWNHPPVATKPAQPLEIGVPKSMPDQQLPPVAVHTPQPSVDPNPAPPEEKQARPGTLKIEHAPLFTVLKMISEVCGVDVEPAPGMSNPDVVVDYRDLTAMEMLHDLGRQYGFTAMDQHDGSIIVVPAIDPKDAPMEGSDGDSLRMRKVGG